MAEMLHVGLGSSSQVLSPSGLYLNFFPNLIDRVKRKSKIIDRVKRKSKIVT